MAELDLDIAAVEAAIGVELPRPQLLRWRLLDLPGGVELEITSAAPVAWQCISIPAWLVGLLAQAVLGALRSPMDRIGPDRARDGVLVVEEVDGFELTLSGRPDDLWWGLRHRERRQLSVVPFALGSDLFCCLHAATCVLIYHGLARPPGPKH